MSTGTGDNILKPSSADIDMNLLRLQIRALNEKLSKQAKIIKLLKQSNEFYEYTSTETLRRYDIEAIGYNNFKHGLYARSIRLQIAELEKKS